MEQALRVPSVQSRLTSSVHPSSKCRATGRPTMATPTIFLPSERPIENFVAHYFPVVPVVLLNKGICLFQCHRYNFKHFSASSPWLKARRGSGSGRFPLVLPQVTARERVVPLLRNHHRVEVTALLTLHACFSRSAAFRRFTSAIAAL